MYRFARRYQNRYGHGVVSLHTTPLSINSVMAVFGDSIAAAAYSASPPIYSNLVDGFATWSNAFAQSIHFVPLLGNLGIPGNLTSDMLVRVNTVIDVSPTLVLMNGGVNDRLDGQTAANTITNLSAIHAALLSADVQYIVQLTITPFFAPNALSGEQEANRQEVNTWLLSLTNPRIKVVNVGSLTAEHFLADGYHPNVLGSSAIGVLVAEKVNAITESGSIFDVLTNAYSPNATLAGNGGSLSGGATGSVATGFTLIADNAGGATVVGAKESFDDDEWQTITLGGTGSGHVLLNYFAAASGVANGDALEAVWEIRVDGLDNIQGIDVEMNLLDGSFASVLLTKGGSAGGVGTTELPTDFDTIIMRTPPGIVTATPTYFSMGLLIAFMPGTVSPTGKVWARRNLARKL